MKTIAIDALDTLPGRRIRDNETFCFRCHKDLGCFNRCCRNLNLFLYPYDVLRLKQRLGLTSDAFLDRYVDVVMRPENHFPDVLLKMAENDQRTCPFLSEAGCRVYPDRPDACRTFPVEQGRFTDPATGRHRQIHFFRPPDFCLGQHETDSVWTPAQWEADQDARTHHRMTGRWADIKALFSNDPWGPEGPEGKRAKMAFMASYNLDRFREFLFGSSFFERYKVNAEVKKAISADDVRLMEFGFDWIKWFIWGMPAKTIRLKKR